MPNPLCTSQWLFDHIDDPDLILLDASFDVNQTKIRDSLKGIKIKGARYFDLKNVFSDQESDFPNTLPGAATFEKGCREIGIRKDSQIVIYDNLGIYTSPRAWWLFKAMGHENVCVLDGGLPEWVAHHFPTAPIAEQTYATGDFEARYRPAFFKDYTFVQSNITAQDSQLIDARSSGRFNGTAPEPRKTLKSGCIPNSISLPYTEVLENGKYKSKAALETIFATLKTGEKPLVFSCGSGITACIILLAAELVSPRLKSVYDGSWTEWATRQGLTT